MEFCLENQDAQKNRSQSFSPMNSEQPGIQKITPIDFNVCIYVFEYIIGKWALNIVANRSEIILQVGDDYWFQSDHGMTLTDMWGKQYFKASVSIIWICYHHMAL